MLELGSMAEEVKRRVPTAFIKATAFASLSEAELEDIASLFRLRRFDQGEFLFHEDNPARTYYLIARGQVKVLQTSAEGYEVILHVLGPGELVGALPTLGEGNYPASTVAMSGVTAFAISSDDFEGVLSRYPQVTRNLLRFATRVIQNAHRKLRELATERVERRIARTLTRLVSQLGRASEEGIVIDTPLSRQDLAEMTGTTLFTVSRTLKGWERRGILRARRKQVIITNPHALVTIGEDLPERERQAP